MFSKKKTSALLLSLILSVSSIGTAAFSVSAAGTEEASAEAESETDTAETEEASEDTTEEPEEITSGEYTYYIDEDYGGAVITAYEPEESNVVIPDEIDGVPVVGLDDFLFDDQTQIETVTIPKNLCHIGATAFYGTSIREFFVEEGHSMYKAEDGVLFSRDGIALVAYPPKKEDTSYTVPDGVEELYHGCFAGNTYLTELTLPDGLIYIDSWAFAYTIIQELDIPDSVTTIESYAFAYMKRLLSIKTPPELLVINSATFAGCSNLSEVTLNEGLTDINQCAFAGTEVRSIVIPTTVENIGYCAFGYSEDLTTSYSTLVIYGLSGSIAETYATDTDSEYDYENNFTFIAKTSAQIQAMLTVEDDSSDGSSAEDTTEPAVIVETEDNSSAQFTWKVVIIALGAAVLCGGICAIAISSKKDKDKTDDKKNKGETDNKKD